MKLKTDYNIFIKLKELSRIINITGEIIDFDKKDNEISGFIEIKGIYLKYNEFEASFKENIPFSIIFKAPIHDDIDLECSDIEFVVVEGRGIDVSFSIVATYIEVRNIKDEPIDLIQNNNQNEYLEVLKEEETERIDKLMHSSLNVINDNSATNDLILRGLKDNNMKIKVCYYQNDSELERICTNNNVSLNELFNNNRNSNIEKYNRVIIYESTK